MQRFEWGFSWVALVNLIHCKIYVKKCIAINSGEDEDIEAYDTTCSEEAGLKRPDLDVLMKDLKGDQGRTAACSFFEKLGEACAQGSNRYSPAYVFQ